MVCPQTTPAKLLQEKRGRSHLIYTYVLYSKKGVHRSDLIHMYHTAGQYVLKLYFIFGDCSQI